MSMFRLVNTAMWTVLAVGLYWLEWIIAARILVGYLILVALINKRQEKAEDRMEELGITPPPRMKPRIFSDMVIDKDGRPGIDTREYTVLVVFVAALCEWVI